MHELGIARDIMRTVAEHSGGRKILSVVVEVGPLAGVAVASLDFCIGEVSKEMGLGEPKITIREVPVKFKCECGAEYEATDPLDPCPSCGGYSRTILEGLDVVVREIEVEDS